MEVESMDPMSRIIMEKVIEAIEDAGFHPSEIEGTRTGVFVTTINSDSHRLKYEYILGKKHFALTGQVADYS